MELGHVELFVRDPEASRRFYEGVLGFEVFAVQHGGKVLWLRCGGREILLRPGGNPAPAPSYTRGAAGLVLFTDDLPAAMERLRARGLSFEGDDGPGCPTFRDPDGNWWQLVNPAEA